MRFLITATAILSTACGSPDVAGSHSHDGASANAGSDQPTAGPEVLPWSADYDPPLVLDTARVHLEPLAPEHVELDFEALMGSREHLQRTLGWGDWPRVDFTLEENLADLERHWQEFVDREGYAYTVLSPDRSRCLGCVYLVPLPGTADDVAALAFWVIEPELATDLDRHLLESLTRWFDEQWSFRRVVLAENENNVRGRELAGELGFEPSDSEFEALARMRPDNALQVWTRAE